MHSKHLLAVVVAAFASIAQAGVSAEDAAKLKTTLTPLGGERAGNKDGTIPAWEGGYGKVPAGYKSGDPRPDPFAAEKPLLSINSKNMAQYADRLTVGGDREDSLPKALHESLHRHGAKRKGAYMVHSVPGEIPGQHRYQ